MKRDPEIQMENGGAACDAPWTMTSVSIGGERVEIFGDSGSG
jgi:hypothetical protein